MTVLSFKIVDYKYIYPVQLSKLHVDQHLKVVYWILCWFTLLLWL